LIVEQAIERGEVPPDTQPRQVIESVLGPIHLRLLLTGEPISPDFLQAIVDVVADGLAQRRAQGLRTSPR
jgi:Tetracyclin repressor-like, C-terminal domain